MRNHARLDRDKVQFDQWRPYVIMMHARAVATPLVELKQTEAAITSIEAGIRRIEEFLEDYGREDQAERINELIYLKHWRRELAGEADSSEEDSEAIPWRKSAGRLAEAIEQERYEEASELRDELRRLEEPPPPTGPAMQGE